MIKSTFLKIVQSKLPEDIIIEDSTNFEFTEDEYIGMLSWIQYFNDHYTEYKKQSKTKIQRPLISKRLQLDFGHYNIPCDLERNKGKYIVYIIENRYIARTLKIDDWKALKVK